MRYWIDRDGIASSAPNCGSFSPNVRKTVLRVRYGHFVPKGRSDMFQDHGETIDNRRRRMDRAITVFEQLLDSPDTADSSDEQVSEPVRLAQVRAAVAGSFDVYSRLFLQTFDLYEDLVQEALGTPAQTPQDASLIITGSADEPAEAPLWIHNTTGEDAADVAAWMTTLTAHEGSEIPGSSGAVTPMTLAVPAGGSRDVLLTIKVPMSTPPGLYHGHVLVTGLPSASLPVRLLVTT